MTRTRHCVDLAVAVLGVAAILVTVAGAPAPLRAPIVLTFLLLAPGLVLVRPVGLRDPLVELTLAVAASVAIDMGAALILLYAGAWSPTAILIVVVGLTLAGLAGGRAWTARAGRAT